MFDPLSSPFESTPTSSIEPWGDVPTKQQQQQQQTVPPTPTSPQVQQNPTPAGSRSPLPPDPVVPNGKEAKVYGEPDRGFSGVDGSKPSAGGQYLRIRVVAIDRNRRDIIIRMDAQTNLPGFTGNSYRGISRSYAELVTFHECLCHSNPQTIVEALPLAQTSAATDEEDDRIVKVMLQRWLTRICEDPVILRDDELRSFIESEFGYTPQPRPIPRKASSFSLLRRTAPPDEDEHLQQSRFELAKLETLFFECAKSVDKLARARRALGMSHVELGNKFVSVAQSEVDPPLGGLLKRVGRMWAINGDICGAEGVSEVTILGDTLGYQGLNAKGAKETLQARSGVLEEYQGAVKHAISKRRQIERLKSSSSIRPERVDEALEELEEANKYEQVLARRVDGISSNLHRSLKVHGKHVDDDLRAALIEHARISLMYERSLLKDLEAVVSGRFEESHAPIKKKMDLPRQVQVPITYDRTGSVRVEQTGPVVSRYGDDEDARMDAAARRRQEEAAQRYIPPAVPVSASYAAPGPGVPRPFMQQQVSSPPQMTSGDPPQTPSKSSTIPGPLSPSPMPVRSYTPQLPQSPGAGSSRSHSVPGTPAPSVSISSPLSPHGPLSGHMHPQAGLPHPAPPVASGPFDPLSSTLPPQNAAPNMTQSMYSPSQGYPQAHAQTMGRSSGAGHPLANSLSYGTYSAGGGPGSAAYQATQGQTHGAPIGRDRTMSQSMMLPAHSAQQQRKRLDAREAASKLANFL